MMQRDAFHIFYIFVPVDYFLLLKTTMTVHGKLSPLLLLLLALLTATVSSEYEVPTKKAIPPKMDPIP
jgi:predicted CDP-diglyceride synthetase/phosphatidate cytidylyltransferase